MMAFPHRAGVHPPGGAKLREPS
ncbi:hypothetical protein SBA7_300059 [Candidatus Sulfotelmatobacter sp. SbA7]|nr:hypothetical protein SBA7_300059 [Candidatus Sulfotelmatobacter sp. SbA7]